MTSSPPTEPLLAADQPHLELICQFLSGDLSLFALEQSLSESIWPFELAAELQGLNWQDPELRTRLEPLLRQALSPGQASHWLLLRVLPWILSEEPRACRSVEVCRELQLQGLNFLGVIGAALSVGELPEDPVRRFDWDRVRNVIPELKPAAGLILHSLSSGEVRITDGEDDTDKREKTGRYKISEQLRPLLEPESLGWREANQAIAAWLERHQHLHA